MKDPWLRPAPESMRPFTDVINDYTVEDRLYRLKEFDAEKLRAIIAWRGTQITVRKAAERRLRKLERGKR